MNHSDDLHEELKDSPLLRSFKKEEPFEVPEGYFDRLTASLQDKLEDEAVLEEAPMLSKAGKKNIFIVPQGYFEQLPNRVMQLLPDGGQVKSMRRMFRPNYSWAVAAAIAILVAIFLSVGGKRNASAVEEFAFDENLKEEELYEALEAAGVDSYDLMAALEENGSRLDEFFEKEDFPSLPEEELLNELEMGELEDLILEM